MKTFVLQHLRNLRRSARYVTPILLLCSVELTGCGGTVGFAVDGGTTLPISANSLTGGWVFKATPTTSPAPFVQLSGSLDERSATNNSNPLQALLQIQGPGSCYIGSVLLPLQGTVQKSAASLYSFEVNAQYLTITATADATNTTLNGTYSVGGGCANGAKGTISGTRYLPLKGPYGGTTTGGQSTATTTLSLTEAAQGNGDGSFTVTGTGQFQNLACFTSATITSGSVLGSAVHLVMSTNETAKSSVTVDGTFNPAATAINASSIVVTGGGCAGSLGTANLLPPS